MSNFQPDGVARKRKLQSKKKWEREKPGQPLPFKSLGSWSAWPSFPYAFFCICFYWREKCNNALSLSVSVGFWACQQNFVLYYMDIMCGVCFSCFSFQHFFWGPRLFSTRTTEFGPDLMKLCAAHTRLRSLFYGSFTIMFSEKTRQLIKENVLSERVAYFWGGTFTWHFKNIRCKTIMIKF